MKTAPNSTTKKPTLAEIAAPHMDDHARAVFQAAMLAAQQDQNRLLRQAQRLSRHR